MDSELFEAGSGNKAVTLPDAGGQNMRILIEQEAVAINLMKGPDFIIERVNKLMLALMGKTREEVLNKSLLQVFPEDKNKGRDILLTRTFNTGEPCYEFELPVVAHNDREEKTLYVNFLYLPFNEFD